MADERKCEHCGADLPVNAPQGLCPRCLVRMGIGLAEECPPLPPPAKSEITERDSLIGKVRYFGDYELLEEIARGGMGIVYKARQVSLNRTVAVKMLLFGKLSSDEFVQRFHAEAEAIAHLHHPNIVAIHEIGEYEGHHYFSMDFVNGQSLAELAGDKPLPNRKAAGYIKTIADATHYAHQRGILHRDLKPSNVLIDEFDQPRITDFGLAKQLKRDSELTGTGQMLGSPNYMPPEQADANCGAVGTYSDVYSLGAVLYRLLTGRPPFLAETIESTLLQLLSAEPVAPRFLNPDIPEDLEVICLKCLEKEPKHRYGSAQELAEDLERWLQHKPIKARPSSSGEKVIKWAKRKPTIALLAASVFVLLALLSAGSMIAAFRIDRARRTAIQAENEAKKAQQETIRKLYESYLAQVRANRLSGRPGRFFDTIETIAKAAKIRPSLELRNEAIASLALVDLQIIPLSENNPLGGEFERFDSTLEVYAWKTPDGDISLRQTKDNRELKRIPTRAMDVRWIHGFSPDSRFLMFGTGMFDNCAWDLKQDRMAFQKLALPGGLAISTSEDSFVTLGPDGNVLIYDWNAHEEARRHTKASPGAQAKAMDPSGSRLACQNSEAKMIEVIELKTGAVTATMKIPGYCEEITWSPDGKWLAAGCVDNRAYIWDATSGELLRTCIGHDNRILRLAFNHAGTLLATTSWDDTVRLWDPFTGAQLLSFRGSSWQMQFSPDDRRLAYVGAAQFGLLKLTDHFEYRRFSPSARNGSGDKLAISPDDHIAAAIIQGQVRFWNYTSGREIGFLPDEGCCSVFFDSDGKSIITCGLSGLVRWPLQTKSETAFDAFDVRYTREPYSAAGVGLSRASMSISGEIAFAHYYDRRQARILDQITPDKVAYLGNHSGVHYVSVSPDGQWVATGTWNGSGVKIWDAKTGQMIQELSEPGHADVLFSPDGQWLITAGVEYHLWKTGTWQPGAAISLPTKNVILGAMSFSKDSRYLAVALDGRAVRLLETQTARTLADFEAPTLSLVNSLCFNDDGSELLACDGLGQIHAWNLRLIRQRLIAMRLDWDSPMPDDNR